MLIVDAIVDRTLRDNIFDAALTPARLPSGRYAPNDGCVMNTSTLLGSICLLLGTSALIAGVFRAMGHSWFWGVHELYLLPLAGLCLVLVGQMLLK